MDVTIIAGVLLLFFSISSIIEYRIYVLTYSRFRRFGVKHEGIVVDSFIGKSEKLPISYPIRGLPIIEFNLDGEEKRMKTFANQFSPLTTFAFYKSKVKILVDEGNQEYCMIDWKAPVIVGAVFNMLTLVGGIYLIWSWIETL